MMMEKENIIVTSYLNWLGVWYAVNLLGYFYWYVNGTCIL